MLFIKLPSYATGDTGHGNGEELQRLWNGFYDFADEKNLSYINFLHEFDDVKINFNEDFYDWTHMNYWGNLEMTNYLGKYISENYNIKDRRNDAAYKSWEDAYLVYENYILQSLEMKNQELPV